MRHILYATPVAARQVVTKCRLNRRKTCARRPSVVLGGSGVVDTPCSQSLSLPPTPHLCRRACLAVDPRCILHTSFFRFRLY